MRMEREALVEGSDGRSTPTKTYCDSCAEYMWLLGLNREAAEDLTKWKARVLEQMNTFKDGKNIHYLFK